MRTQIIKISILFFLSIIFNLSCFAQYHRAFISNEFGKIDIEPVVLLNTDNLKSETKNQLTSWPKAFECNPSFKNMRGVCIQDINNDDIEDIIFATNSKIYAYSGTGEKYWEAALTGTAIYPPSAADINNDGFIEIVQVTGGSPANGRIHIFDHNGNTYPGWPVNFDDHWIICAPALADLNNDKQLEIIVAERRSPNPGLLHVLKNDGTSYSENFPLTLDGTPAVTPSVAYLRNWQSDDIIVDSLIVMCSTSSIFAYDFNGNMIDGFPISNENTGFSYQSPLICVEKSTNLMNEEIKIIGATHGNLPEYYAINKNGEYVNENWPIPTVDNSWTYSAPTAIGLHNYFDFYLMSQPGANGTDLYPTIHAFTPEGEYVEGFPFERVDGLEGFITAMYSVDHNTLYIFTGSNMKDESGNGYIHAYTANTDLSNFVEMSGFPVQVQGFTFMNGINLGDVNGNGKLDLIALSYDLNMVPTDSTHINVIELPEIDYNPHYCYGTYKGNNLRNGLIIPPEWIPEAIDTQEEKDFLIYPNPCKDLINFQSTEVFDLYIYDITGKIIFYKSITNNSYRLDTENWTKGMYFVRLSKNNKIYNSRVIKM
ncbi:MAG: T9SS type A sorting domain-containing protein [Bacteroidales bacterium]|nr:T9SS type A sorting domain-containing protein [Bacteroidales bacterium]MDD3858782.1 T9SS type A sorting domain-containing protein [Bacteroidales bacterium]